MVSGINKNTLSYMLSPRLLYSRYKRYALLKKYKSKHLQLGDQVSIKNSEIGEYVFLGSFVRLKNSSIGNHSYVNDSTEINYTSIGKFCSIGSNVEFGMGKHPTDLISTHPAFYSNNKEFKTFSRENHFNEYERIQVGNDVWIGSNAMIMGGVTIDDGAIVATGAVVTKDVKAYEIVGGVPAKHIKFRINESHIEKIRSTKWWDNDEQWFEKNYSLFLDNNKFLDYFK